MSTLTPLHNTENMTLGNCATKDVHGPHIHHSKSLGVFWCRGVEEEDAETKGRG